MTKEEAFKYWELFYQGRKEAFDYANILMKKEDYQNEKSKSGWTIDNKDIKKIALNQNETFLNTFPCSITAKNIRQNKQHFQINGREFNFIVDKKTKEKKLYEIKGKNLRCVDPHQRLEERINDKDNEKIMDISGVKIKARQELNGNLVLVATNEEQLITALFSLADYIDKFKNKVKGNKNILVEIQASLGKNYEIPKQIYISTETNKSEEILLFRELILNKRMTTFDYNEEEKTLYCYDENQTRKDSFIKKKQMLKDEIYYLTIKIEGDKGNLSLFFSEELDDIEEEKAPEIDASFTFNLNKHDFTQEIKKEEKEQEELKNAYPKEQEEPEEKSKNKEEVIKEPNEEEVIEESKEEIIDQQEQIEAEESEEKEVQEEVKEETKTEPQEEQEESEEIDEEEKEIEESEENEEDTQEIVNEKYSHRFETLLNLNKEEIKKDLERISLEKAKKEMKAEEEKVKEKEKERQEQEEINKLNSFLSQEKYKTKVFKKPSNEAVNNRRKEVDEVAKVLVEDIKKEKQEKKEQEEKARREYEERIRLEQEELERKKKEEEIKEAQKRMQEELAKMDEKQAEVNEITKEKEDNEKEIPTKNIDPDLIQLTAELKKEELEKEIEETRELEKLVQEEYSNDQENTIQIADESELEELEEQTETSQQEEAEESFEKEETEEKEESIEEKERKKEEVVAKQLFRKVYGDKAEKGKDFAGRTIKFSDYGNINSETGWNYILLKDSFGVDLENIILANVQTLEDFKMNQKFESNGHTFFVTKVGEKNILQSDDVLINPFSYYEAKRLANINKKKKNTLIYMYIRCTEFDGLSVQSENFNIFADFVQRSIFKMIVSSLVKYEIGKDYIFIALDGEKSEAYEEAYNYAILLNSYRKELKKDKIINAIIVLSLMEIHHLNINKSVKDLVLVDPTFKAVVEELSKKNIDPTIKRAIHIGPEVLNHLSVDRNLLSKSRLIQNIVKEEFYECKFVYMLNREII